MDNPASLTPIQSLFHWILTENLLILFTSETTPLYHPNDGLPSNPVYLAKHGLYVYPFLMISIFSGVDPWFSKNGSPSPLSSQIAFAFCNLSKLLQAYCSVTSPPILLVLKSSLSPVSQVNGVNWAEAQVAPCGHHLLTLESPPHTSVLITLLMWTKGCPLTKDGWHPPSHTPITRWGFFPLLPLSVYSQI